MGLAETLSSPTTGAWKLNRDFFFPSLSLFWKKEGFHHKFNPPCSKCVRDLYFQSLSLSLSPAWRSQDAWPKAEHFSGIYDFLKTIKKDGYS